MRAVLKEATRGRPWTQAHAHLYKLVTVDTGCPSRSHSPVFPWKATAPSSDSAIDAVNLNHPGNPTPFARDWLGVGGFSEEVSLLHCLHYGDPRPQQGRLLTTLAWPLSPGPSRCCTAEGRFLSFSRSVASDSVTPWTAAHQASLSPTISQSLLKLTSIESVKPSNHLIHCHPLLLLHSIFPSIRVFSHELVLCIRWPMYGPRC